jgi:hypothetical protein
MSPADVGTGPRLADARPMFEPKFIEHRGVRILRLEFANLEPHELVVAAAQVQRVITGEPRRSVRVLTVLTWA